MNTAQLLRQIARHSYSNLCKNDMRQGGILTLRYILDNMGFESHEDMIRIQEFLRDLEMER